MVEGSEKDSWNKQANKQIKSTSWLHSAVFAESLRWLIRWAVLKRGRSVTTSTATSCPPEIGCAEWRADESVCTHIGFTEGFIHPHNSPMGIGGRYYYFNFTHEEVASSRQWSNGPLGTEVPYTVGPEVLPPSWLLTLTSTSLPITG